MAVCAQIKGYVRQHEWIADTFSLLGVGLLFGTIWVLIDYQYEVLTWAQQNVVLHIPAIMLALAADVALIFGCLCVGSTRCEGERGCFHSFKGRRHGGASLYGAFNNWIVHMENVGKKHR